MIESDGNAPIVAKINALDTTVFAIQPGHYPDRISFLRIQRLLRTLMPGYTYLEIGSDLGASLLPHLLDPDCAAVVSIDPRPELQPDERGVDFRYAGNSTTRMLGELGKHANPAELAKLCTIEADASNIGPAWPGKSSHLVLIDGEHTNVAAFSDFMAVLPLIADNALVTFHDANLISDTLQIIERLLIQQQTNYSMVILPSCVAVFAFGDLVGPVETTLAPHAEPKAAYYAAARRERHDAVADAVIGRAEGLRGNSIKELAAWTKDVENRLAGANAERDYVQRVLNRAEASIEEMQMRMDCFVNSTSWTITAPLRAAKNLLRGGSR